MTLPDDIETPRRPLSQFQKLTIMLGSVAMGAGMTINFVVVAPLAREAGLREVEVAAILSLSTLIFTFIIPVWGRLADRYGRKRIMAFSMVAMGVTNMMFLYGVKAALAGAITGINALAILIFLRAFFGFLAPGFQPASMAALTDASTSRDRAATLGMLAAGVSLGSIIGPSAAAALAPLGALAPLWASILFCIFTGIFIFVMLPKTQGGRSSHRPSPLKMTDLRVRPYLIVVTFHFAAVSMIQQTLGWTVLDRYDLSEAAGVQATGLVFAAIALGMIIGQFGIQQPFKPDPRRILPIGLALSCVSYLLAEMLNPFAALCLVFIINGLGAALTVPSANALGSLSVGPGEQASAAALMATAPPAGFILGPLVGAGLYMVNTRLPLALAALVTASLAAYTVMLLTRPRAQGTASGG